MARAPIIQPERVAQAPGAALQSGAGLASSAQGLGALARGVQDLQAGAEQYLENAAVLEAENTLSKARMAWTQTLIERQDAAQADAPQFAAQFGADFKAYMADTVGAASSRAQQRVQIGLMRLEEQLAPKALAFEAARRVAWRGDQIQETMRTGANMLMSNPEMFGDSMTGLEQAIRAQGLPADTEAAFLRAARAALAEGALTGSMRVDPVGTMQSLDRGQWDQYLTPDAKERFLNMAQPAAGRAFARAALGGPALAEELHVAGQRGDYAAQAKALVPYVINVESRGDPNAESPVGASGIMQFMPTTAPEVARRMGIRALEGKTEAEVKAWLKANPELSIQMGERYLTELLERYDGDVVLALASYNGGMGNVDKWLARHGDPRTGAITHTEWLSQIFPETRAYVPKVLNGTPWRQALEQLPDNPMGRAARAEAQRIAAEASERDAQYLAGLDDELAFLRAGNPIDPGSPYTRERLAANLSNPMLAQEVWDQKRRAARDGEIFASVAVASGAELAARRAEFAAATETPAGFQSAAERLATFDEAVRRRQRAIAEDPAAYVVNNVPEARDRLEAEEFNPRLFALTQINSQTRLGVNERDMRVLPKAQAEQMVKQIDEMQPSEVGPYLRALEGQWGEGWGAVMVGLQEAGLPDGYRFAALFARDPALSQQIVEATQQADELKGSMSGPVKAEMTVQIDDLRDKLKEWRTHFEYAGVTGPEEFNALAEVMENWSLLRMRRGGTNIPTEAIERFLEANYLNPTSLPSNVEAVIPRIVGDSVVTEDAVRFSTRARQTEAAIRAFNPAPFGTETLAGAVRGEGQLLETIRAAANDGVWAMNEVGDGLVLMLPSADHAVMVPLQNEAGALYEVLFKDMTEGAVSPGGGAGRRQEPSVDRLIREREEAAAAAAAEEAAAARRALERELRERQRTLPR